MKRKIKIKGKSSPISTPPPLLPVNQNRAGSGKKRTIKIKGQSSKEEVKPPKQQRIPAFTKPKVKFPKIKRSWFLVASGIVGLVIIGVFALPLLTQDQKELPIPSNPEIVDPNQPYKEFVLGNYHLHQKVVKEEQSVKDIFQKYKFSKSMAEQAWNNASHLPDLRKLTADRPYLILTDKENKEDYQYLIYEPDNFKYIILPLQAKEEGKLVHRKIRSETKTVAGMLIEEESFLDVIVRNQYRQELIEKIEEALKWSVDLHHIKAGDKFKVAYDEKLEGNKPIGVGQIYAVYFNTNGKEYYAYNYEYEGEESFYTVDARPVKSTFLMSPVKYARISSAYNLKRKHPVTGIVKGHYGTDYAAPEGTPILAVADGEVTIAGFKTNNGNYVKLRHDEVYETQYLHMQKIEPGIEPGVRVTQGQVIGYVGQTGLATGPHVCFRFWKNAKQVNHLEEDLPTPTPLSEQESESFYFFRDSFNRVLETVTYFK